MTETRGRKTTENKDDYLIRYKISIFMYDPRETALSLTTHGEHKAEGLEIRSLCQERDRVSDLCNIVEGVASTLYSLNVLLLQQGIDCL